MSTHKIVITGGPGTGKSSIINELKRRNHFCFEEISREVILDARKNGTEQLFLTEPLLFSQLLLKGRLSQYEAAQNHPSDTVFLDRGIPDILAYMDYIGDKYPDEFVSGCTQKPYTQVFILAPWEAIFTSDSERYENFEQAVEIHKHLVAAYKRFNYHLIDVPFGTVEERTDFILESLNL